MQAKAINFALERQRHRGFLGRRTLLAQLDQLLVEKPADRWVVVTGGPGMGKSALLSTWLARREAAGDLVPHHFVRRQWANWDDPGSLVGSLIAQIEARFPDLPEPEVDANLSPAARLSSTLGRVSEAVLIPRGERLVVLIDGLDEYDPPPGRSPSDPLGAFAVSAATRCQRSVREPAAPPVFGCARHPRCARAARPRRRQAVGGAQRAAPPARRRSPCAVTPGLWSRPASEHATLCRRDAGA